MSGRRRRPLLVVVVAVVACAGAVVALRAADGGEAPPPPPRPVAEVRALLGNPRVGDGVAMSVDVTQSVVPGAALGRFGLPDGTIRGRLWIRSGTAWRLELQGTGHDWQLTREDGLLRLYWSGSQTAYTLARDVLPTGIAAVGSTGVPPAEPGTVAGRAVHHVTWRPRGEGLLIDRIRVAVDAETGAPLDIAVWSVRGGGPVVRMRATAFRHERVGEDRIRVRPPAAGSTVPIGTLLALGERTGQVRTVGEGWGRVLLLPDLPGAVAGLGGNPDGDVLLRTPLISVVGAAESVAVGALEPEEVRARARR